MPEVAGSLWSVPAADRPPALERLGAAGLRRLHWDRSDGRFAAAGGFTAAEALTLTEATGMAAEAHLMVTDPVAEVDPWTEFCDLVVVHAEAPGWQQALERVLGRGCRPGLAISPLTPPRWCRRGWPRCA
ncbi:hypothetical protein H9L10_11805 [Phycicoccus endophyticus]|uniref:Uncharacterized protein n=1 Tax=Phycicoccus endophyticus TaxID=1690220 RepID=A0A7G9R020_9MICO|nr:hypothetical protein [Phycicoccus endophyticus]QNN48945.1 hypothetical protein H9L10_11805 [Phycicoccus endophyticus]